MIETALGLHGRPGGGLRDVAAAAADGLLAVADGTGGHGAGWLGARRVVRSLVDGLVAPGARRGFVGAASDDGLDEANARWMKQHAAVTCPVPSDLVEAFIALDAGALATRMPGGQVLALAVGCTAAKFAGARVSGAHAGPGRVAVLRAGADRLEDLVVPHLLDRVATRSPSYRELDPATLPPRVAINALGMLATCGIGVDRFATELATGDVLLVCSSELAVCDATLVARVRAYADRPLAELARALEDLDTPPGDVAFALARPR